MAITLIQQLEIIRGTLKPPTKEITIDALVHQSAYVMSKKLIDEPKDTTDNEEATAYLDKINTIVRKVIMNDRDIIQKITRMMITIISLSDKTYVQITNATDDHWMSFIEANILEAMGYIAEVTKAEKQAYLDI